MTRSTTTWSARKAPDWRSMASSSVVLPWSTCATMAMSRTSARTAWPGRVVTGAGFMGSPIVARPPTAPYAARVQVRDPVPRSLDIIAAELLLSASQAFLVGVLMYLAIGIWDDRGVGFGPVAVTLAGLGLVIGGAWLYWLSGGVGWPLAAGNVPVAIFLGFALVLGWQGGDIVRVEGVPLLLSLSASVYGLVCGVFLDSPRRRRWDQRQKPRPGASVPRISPTTRMFVARVPRSVPRRSTVAPAGFPTMPQEQATMAAAADPMAGSFGGGSSRGALADGDTGGRTRQLAR